MTKEEFIDLITKLENFNKEVTRFEELGIYLINSSLYAATFSIINTLLRQLFTYKQNDYIYWYLYGRVNDDGTINPSPTKDGETYIKNAKDLWYYMFGDSQ